MIDAGYFAKAIALAQDGLNVQGVREVCSVSHCISAPAAKWFATWRHNDCGWFNRIEGAWAVVPVRERARYRMFAYRLVPTGWRKGQQLPPWVPEDVHPEPPPDTFVSLGFDAVSKSADSSQGFEHSPLSCNGMVGEFQANEFCLFATVEAATAAARAFSVEEPEPGDYFVVEVLEDRCS
jgi:hypothetical protein